eukprot:986837_1
MMGEEFRETYVSSLERRLQSVGQRALQTPTKVVPPWPCPMAVAAPSIAPSVPQALPPNNVLFVQNLPAEATEEMLSVLCRQFPGFREARLIEGKPGIGFISFDSDSCSTTAMHALQGFQISPQHRIIINYAKK